MSVFGSDLSDCDTDSESNASLSNQFDLTQTTSKKLSNPLVLVVCVCDEYVGTAWLPGNEKDLAHIAEICRLLNYKDIRQVNVDGLRYGNRNSSKKFLEGYLRPARQYINNSRKHDGLIFFYSGHGSEDSLIFPGGESYKWQFIFDFFNGEDSNCPALNDKPKLFILDNCRGRNDSHSAQQVHIYAYYFLLSFLHGIRISLRYFATL